MNLAKNLLLSWRNSLKIFRPDNLKSSCLLAAHNIKYYISKKLSVSNIAMTIFAIIIIQIIRFKKTGIFDGSKNILIITTIIFITVLYNFIIKMHPTTTGKQIKIRGRTKELFMFIITLFSAISIKQLLYQYQHIYPAIKILSNIFMLNQFSTINNQQSISPIVLSSPLVLFIILFLFDSKDTVYEYLMSIKRAVLMFIYNYPVCFILFNILRLLIFFNTKIVSHISRFSQIAAQIVNIINLLILFIVYIIFLMNFYIDQIHTRFDLYYKKL